MKPSYVHLQASRTGFGRWTVYIPLLETTVEATTRGKAIDLAAETVEASTGLKNVTPVVSEF